MWWIFISSVLEVADVLKEIQHSTTTKIIFVYIFINQCFYKYVSNPSIHCCLYWCKQDESSDTDVDLVRSNYLCPFLSKRLRIKTIGAVLLVKSYTVIWFITFCTPSLQMVSRYYPMGYTIRGSNLGRNESVFSNLITVQQDATYSVYYISVGSSTCFACWHPSSGARTTVITASGIGWMQWLKYSATNTNI
jgi:hypothetical protein